VSTSIPPPAPGGGNTKYAIIGILLLLGAGVAIFFGTRGPAEAPPQAQLPPSPAPVEDAAAPQPTGPTVGAEIGLDLDEPDAAVEEPAPDASRPRIRYVTRYVAACPGTVDGPGVTAVVRANYGGLRECYNRQLRMNPSLQGNVTAVWVINTNGSVGDISTSGAVARDRNFKTCFEGALRRIRFPAPRGGCAMFQQSFTFTSGG
jgi:hypothetical protein